MVVAPIAATPLPLMVALCLAASGTLRGKGITTRESERLCLVGTLSRKRPRLRNGCRSSDGCSWLFQNSQRGKNQKPQRGNRNGIALWLCDVGCSHYCERSCLGCSWTHRGKEPRANRGNGINNEGIGTALPFFCWGEFKLILCYLIIQYYVKNLKTLWHTVT